eukprot:9744752-Alexandrium_andersonii.AAC.1
MNTVLRQVKVNLAQWLAGSLGELFVGDTLQERLRDIRGTDAPPAARGLGHEESLGITLAGAGVVPQALRIEVLEAADGQASTNDTL